MKPRGYSPGSYNMTGISKRPSKAVLNANVGPTSGAQTLCNSSIIAL